MKDIHQDFHFKLNTTSEALDMSQSLVLVVLMS
jgi:hypothetical protein